MHKTNIKRLKGNNTRPGTLVAHLLLRQGVRCCLRCYLTVWLLLALYVCMWNHFTFARRAFTLVELIIVIVILGILAAISIVGYQSVVDRVDQAAAETTLQSVDREYRALAAFNIAADSSAGVPITDMTPIDGIDYSAGDTDGDGLLEPGETISFDGVVLTLSAATTTGSIDGTAGTGGSGGSGGSGSAFSVSYSQQSFDVASSSQALSPTITGAAGPVTYSYTGDLPTGVSFDTTTGEFSSTTVWNDSAIAVATGQYHSCAVLSGGTVQCWGRSTEGQSTVPASVTDAIAVTAGDVHSCAVLSDDTVECWGSGSSGQLAVPASVTDVVAVDAGLYHNCAVLSDGSVECWGRNNEGQLNVPASVAVATDVAAGFKHSCALLSDGTVECWGSGSSGKLAVPASVTDAIAVDAGSDHSCALLSDGTVECWGHNGWGQVAGAASVADATAIAAGGGGSHACALISDGSVHCWGFTDASTVPDSVTDAIDVAAGNAHSCALLSGGSVECWGYDSQGQSTVPPFGNAGFPASIEVTATDGTNTATFTVELTVS